MRKREKQPKQNGGMAKRVMVLLLLAVFLFSLYRVLHILQGYRTAQAVYDKAGADLHAAGGTYGWGRAGGGGAAADRF